MMSYAKHLLHHSLYYSWGLLIITRRNACFVWRKIGIVVGTFTFLSYPWWAGNFLIVSPPPQNFSSLICMNYSSHFYGNDSIFSFLSHTQSRVTFCVYSMRPHFSLSGLLLFPLLCLRLCNLKYSPLPPHNILSFPDISNFFIALLFAHTHSPTTAFRTDVLQSTVRGAHKAYFSMALL